jgi:hypothetical protein
MKIIKISARMFDTYGLEDSLINLFYRHYKEFLKNNKSKLYIAQRKLDKGEIIKIGVIRTGEFINKIIEKHGFPLNKDYPKSITFIIASPYSSKFQSLGGAFTVDKNNTLYVAITTKDIKSLQFNENVKNTIRHEFQHFIRYLYERSSIFNPSKVKHYYSIEYFNIPREIQANCYTIALNAFNSWKEIAEYYLKNKNRDKIIKQINMWKDPKNLSGIITFYLLNSFRNFDNSYDNVISENEETKKKYLYYSYRNFELLFRKYIEDLENKVLS